jgi:hypothetical protein
MRGIRYKDFRPIMRALSVQKKVSENKLLCIKHNFQLKLVCSIHSVVLLNITLFKSKKIRCVLSVLQKERRKVWGARYTLGARYRSENTVLCHYLFRSFGFYWWMIRQTDISNTGPVNFFHTALSLISFQLQNVAWLSVEVFFDFKCFSSWAWRL